MSYLAFLTRWYNLVFVALAIAGLAVGLAGRLARRRTTAVSVGLVAAATIGLTWNGALHDLGIGGYERRFPVILLVALLAGMGTGVALDRLRRRLLPPVEGVLFTEPGHEGTIARVVTRAVGPAPASGRAQWQDEAGVIHIVRCHTGEGELKFGRRVRLDRFDDENASYLVEVAR